MRSRKALYNISTNLLLQLITIIYGFIIPKIIISNFGSNVNGLVSSITQFLAYIALLESGFGPVVKSVLYKPIANKNNKEIISILKSSEKFFRTISKIFIIYIIVLSIIYPLIVLKNFEFIYTFSLVIIISISTFAEYYFGMTYRLFLQAKQKTYIISVIQIITYMISIVTIILLVKLNSSIHLIKLISGLIFILRPLLQNYYVRKKYNIKLKNESSNYAIKQKWDGLAQHIASVVHNNTDITVLTLFSNLVEVSVYSVYILIIKGVNSIIQAFISGLDASFGDMIVKKEHDNLNKKFNMYEVVYFSISSIFYICTLMLIVPFVKVYTNGINDANYIRPVFGFLMVLAEFIWAIRLPYSSITLAAGHFNETKKGAWLEAILNIMISVILVSKYGIIGVAIGTITAMTIRTIEFVYHSNKYILKRNMMISFYKIMLCILETILVIFAIKFIPLYNSNSYVLWALYALKVFSITSLIVLIINYIFYKKDYMELFKIIKSLINRKKVK